MVHSTLSLHVPSAGPTPFTLSLPFAKTPRGRLSVDNRLRVLTPPELDSDGHVQGPEDHGTGPKEMQHVSGWGWGSGAVWDAGRQAICRSSRAGFLAVLVLVLPPPCRTHPPAPGSQVELAPSSASG